MRFRGLSVAIALVVLAAAGMAAVSAPDAEAVVYCWGKPLTQSAGLLVGTAGNDVMMGTSGDDVMYGLGGNDTICGGAGNDTIYGGTGRDWLRGGLGNDRLYGQNGCDWLQGEEGNDLLVFGAAVSGCASTAEGGDGRDRFVIDREGDNEIFGGPGRDTVDFRKAPIGIFVDLASGQFWSLGSPPIGSLIWEVENVLGTDWADEVYGNGRRNSLFGFAGDDLILGRGGDDYLNGGAGLGDWMEGGAGDDTCEDPDGFIVMDECEH
jgi:Ca2+-binding RTX toxin-like protein